MTQINNTRKRKLNYTPYRHEREYAPEINLDEMHQFLEKIYLYDVIHAALLRG